MHEQGGRATGLIFWPRLLYMSFRMKREPIIPDLFVLLSLRLIAAINLLFALSLLAVLMLATGRAQAEEAVCGGNDLVADLAAEDPAKLASIRQEAASIPNGEGLLWRVEGKEGAAPSYVFGTMHVADPRVLQMSEPVRKALAEAQTVAIETTDILDQSAMLALFSKAPELTMFPPGESLTDYLTPEEREVVSAALAERGVPLASVVKMKPWMLVSLISLPECELRRKEAGAPVLEAKLAEEARQAGKRLVGLETAQEQLAAIASLPMELHIEALVGVLELGGRVDDMIETLIALYLKGKTDMFQPVLENLLMQDAQGEEGYAAFEERMIVMRNRIMAERAASLLDEGGAFIAVGAMHLPGENGLVSLLRKAGYQVNRAD